VALVFDLVVGATLASLVTTRGHLRPGETVTVLTPLAEAVAALHAAGGTHCDISPGNIMLTADGRPLLMDLGAARLAGTGAGAVVGTPGYVAPEVRSGERPTEASDVFSLGALAWFCLTGNGAPDTFLRLSEETVMSHVGQELAGIVGRCIDPEPDVRPSSAALPGRFYSPTAAEPVEVVVGSDDASALTHRLRAEAAAPGAEAAQPSRSWFRRVHVERPRWSHRLALLCGIAALATVLGWLTHLGLVPGSAGGVHTGPAHGASSTTGSPGGARAATPVETTVPTGRSSARVPSDDAFAESSAGPAKARALLQDLTDRRVAALVDRDAASLAAVHRTNSPSWRADAALIAELRSDGQRYANLRMTVVEAQLVSQSDTAAVVRARVAVAAYNVMDARGAAASRDAEQGDSLDFHLVRTEAGWRIESVSSPRPT
jgi:serine/threonine-protein kinase